MTNKKNGPINFKRVALVSALMFELTGTASAATIDVDGVTCTLNDAVVAANTDTATGGCDTGVGDDILELPVNGSLNLNATAEITSVVTINGNGSTIQPDLPIRLIDVTGGDLTVNDTILQDGNDGVTGGISAFNGSVLNLNNSTIQNMTGGGVVIANNSSGSINNTLIQNTGGSLTNYYGAGLSIGSATVTVSNSTISDSDNSIGQVAGGIWISNYYGPVDASITNTTISGNTSTANGGGVGHTDYANGSSISLTNVTIVDNTSGGNGGGVFNDASNITISQSLISGNTAIAGAEIESTGGTITAGDYNIFGLNGVSNVVGVTVGGSDIVPMESLTDIVDTTLADNGGPTLTHALADGSPAIDAVPAAECALMTDQTGNDRPQDGDSDMTADCDIGAFENEGVDLDLIFEDGFEG